MTGTLNGVAVNHLGSIVGQTGTFQYAGALRKSILPPVGRRGGEVLARLLTLASDPGEPAEAEVAVGAEGAQAARLSEGQRLAVGFRRHRRVAAPSGLPFRMPTPSVTFAGLPHATFAQPGQIAVLGVDHATPYETGKPSHSAGAPAALRAALTGYSRLADHYDFDIGSVRPDHVVDCGDVPEIPRIRRATAQRSREPCAHCSTPTRSPSCSAVTTRSRSRCSAHSRGADR